MERCPYCDAPVRSGARFCTSCGRRLTAGAGETPISAEGAGERQEAPAVPPAWETAPSVVERSSGGEDWSRRSPLASADLWPASARAQETRPPGDPFASSASDQPAPEAADSGAEADVGPGTAWPESPWASWAMPETSEGGGTGGAAMESTESEPAAAPSADGPEAAAEEAPVESTGAPASTEVAGRRAGEGGEALGRALALVDELRGLLPALAGGSGVDLSAALAELTAARDEAAGLDGQALERATTAVEAARQRPREIDALLGLSGNLDALAVALAARRRYADAVERAIGLLGGPGGGTGSATGDDSSGW